MSDFFQLLVAGLATGAIYALIAIGFTLLWQTSQTINFAQGEFVMLPAFFVLTAMGYFQQPFWVAVLAAFAVSIVLLGVLFKKLMVDPMIRHGVLPLVIATIALALLHEGGRARILQRRGAGLPLARGGDQCFDPRRRLRGAEPGRADRDRASRSACCSCS